MKLKKEFVTYDLDGHQVLVSASGTFSGYVKSNHTASIIVDLLRCEISQDEIVQSLYDKFDAPRDVIERDVDKCLEVLRKVGALDE